MTPLFVVQEKPNCNMSDAMKMYKDTTGRKTVKGTKKLLGAMKAKKILLCTHMTRWYLGHGLSLKSVHQLVEYEQGKPFS